MHSSFALAWLATLAAFVTLAIAVHGTYYLSWDKRPAIEVQALADEQWANQTFAWANHAGQFEIVIAVAFVCFVLLLLRGFRIEAMLLLGTGMMRFAQLALREFIDRPFSWDTPPEPVRVFPNADSFPSGHVLGELLVYGLIFAFAEHIVPWRPVAWTLRLLCGVIIIAGMPARLYVGAHWPSDIVGAVLLAFLYLIPALWIAAFARARASAGARTTVASTAVAS